MCRCWCLWTQSQWCIETPSWHGCTACWWTVCAGTCGLQSCASCSKSAPARAVISWCRALSPSISCLSSAATLSLCSTQRTSATLILVSGDEQSLIDTHGAVSVFVCLQRRIVLMCLCACRGRSYLCVCVLAEADRTYVIVCLQRRIVLMCLCACRGGSYLCVCVIAEADRTYVFM